LAFALLLSFSTVQAKNFIAGSGETKTFTNEVEESGIIAMNNATMYFKNSSLGSSSGGRFTSSIATPLTVLSALHLQNNTTLYTVGIGARNLDLELNELSALYSDGAMNIRSLDMYNQCRFIAPSVSTLETLSIRGNSYAKFTANGVGHLEVRDSIWVTTGKSMVDSAYIRNVTIEFIMNSATDGVYASDKITIDGGEVYLNYNLTNEFIESIMAGDGYFDIFRSNTIVGSIQILNTPSFRSSVADTNGTYSWTVTDISGGYGVDFRVSDFVLIPEPSTYAAIFGFIALVWVAYKRRK